MPPAGRGRGRGRGRDAPAPVLPPLPYLFSSHGRSVPVILKVGLGGLAGAADNMSAVGIPANSGLVARLQFVQWIPQPIAPDGVLRVAVATCHLMRLFIGRCSVGPSAADRQAAAQANVFTGRLHAEAWSRILSTLVDNGLLEQPCHSLEAFDKSLMNLELVDTAPLQLLASDWVPADALNVPAAADNQELHDRLAYARYLNLASVSFLEDTSRPNRALQSYGYLAGAVGACFSQPAREREMDPMHFVIQQLRDHICARAVPDGQAAFGLKRMLPDLVLPAMLRAVTVNSAELTSEFIDALAYATPTLRASVEQRRLHILGSRQALKCSTDLEPSRRSLEPCSLRGQTPVR